MRVREVVAAGDVVALERDLPSGAAQVHRAHLRSAQTGTTTYLAAWERGQARGTGVTRWSGPMGPRARSRYAGVPEIAHLQVGRYISEAGRPTRLLRMRCLTRDTLKAWRRLQCESCAITGGGSSTGSLPGSG